MKTKPSKSMLAAQQIVKSKNSIQQRVYNTIADLYPDWDEKQIKKWMDENITISIVGEYNILD